jgi:hypothetical protein
VPPLFPCAFAAWLHPFFWLSQLRPAADLKSVNVSPSTLKGRLASPELVMGEAATPASAPVKVCLGVDVRGEGLKGGV